MTHELTQPGIDELRHRMKVLWSEFLDYRLSEPARRAVRWQMDRVFQQIQASPEFQDAMPDFDEMLASAEYALVTGEGLEDDGGHLDR